MRNLTEFFYFNKSQQIGLIVLIVLTVFAVSGTALLPCFIDSLEMDDGSGFLKEAKEFKAHLHKTEREQQQERDFYPFKPNTYRTYRKATETKYELFTFDPNVADSVTFVRLGLKPFIARNILRYRAKGGTFATPEAFGKIYGITSEKLEELRPYIQLSDTAQKNNRSWEKTVAQQSDNTPASTLTPSSDTVLLELNAADTVRLQALRGIGRTYAKCIVGYRRILGGYTSIEQLKEVHGMTPEHYEKISAYFAVDSSSIIKIDVNKASIEKLKKHPYIKTFQRAKAIYEYRKKKVKLQDISQLRHLDEFTEEDWQRLAPYLEFK